MSYYWILCLAICFVESFTQGALYEAKLAISPNPFKPLIDETIVVLCQLEKKVSTEARQFQRVNRITIKKGSLEVAILTPDQKEEVEVFNDFAETCSNPYPHDCATGNGKLNISSTVYMQVDVKKLRKSLQDTYTCEVEGTDDEGDTVTVTDTYRLNFTDASISEIVDKLQDVQAQNDYQQFTIYKLQENIDKLYWWRDLHDHELFKQKAEIARVGHTEGGQVDCGGSDQGSWTGGPYRASWIRGSAYLLTKKVRVNFKTAYNSTTAPVVQLSVIGLYNNHEATNYGAVVESVDTRGFVMRCHATYSDPTYRVLDMDVSWTSVAVYDAADADGEWRPVKGHDDK